MRRTYTSLIAALLTLVSIAALAPTVATAGVPTCFGEPATIVGTSGDDNLEGTDGIDVMVGLGGADRLSGLRSADLICAGSGDDSLIGGDGDDQINGGKGSDTLDYRFEDPDRYIQVILPRGRARRGGETLERDKLKLGTIENVFLPCEGRQVNQAIGDSGVNMLVGGDGPNYLWGEGGDDVIYGGGGPDDIYGGNGADIIYGDLPTGDDRFSSCALRRKSDLIDAGAGNDRIFGGGAEDAIVGRQGSDFISGGRLGDTCRGGEGDNRFSACEKVIPLGQECGERGTQTDLNLEPRYVSGAARWMHHGCEVRGDILSTRRGPEHCSWEAARFLNMADPLGQRLSRYSKQVSYVRDTEGVYDQGAQERFRRDKAVPDEAEATGYSRNGWELWRSPDPSYVYLVGEERTEWWPLNTANYGCA